MSTKNSLLLEAMLNWAEKNKICMEYKHGLKAFGPEFLSKLQHHPHKSALVVKKVSGLGVIRSINSFSAHLDYLTKLGFKIVSFDQLEDVTNELIDFFKEKKISKFQRRIILNPNFNDICLNNASIFFNPNYLLVINYKRDSGKISYVTSGRKEMLKLGLKTEGGAFELDNFIIDKENNFIPADQIYESGAVSSYINPFNDGVITPALKEEFHIDFINSLNVDELEDFFVQVLSKKVYRPVRVNFNESNY